MSETETLSGSAGAEMPPPRPEDAQGAIARRAGRAHPRGMHRPMAAIDIPHLLGETHDSLEEQSREGDLLIFRIRKRQAAAT